ncbi:MAG: hypothetical protein CL693_02040 [Cellvibrionaceae bacterium]|nr:hypothetical protein [Cellvibrionaceae bacterium]|tara:strand:+ start:2372 stop:3175 length:804 start_codon:yes stop_codon:yes gene_type:complete
MKDDADSKQSLETDNGAIQPDDKTLSRRGFTKVGVAAPVVMSLFSRPVWAGGSGACSPSSLASGNASGRHQQDCDGNGCTPGFWKNNLLAWQGTGYSPGVCVRWRNGKCKEWSTTGATTFQDIFGFAPAIAVVDPSPMTLLDVMLNHEQSGGEGTYENHLVAALLNAAKAPFIYGTTVDEIIELARCVELGLAYKGYQVTRQEVFDLFVRMNEAGTCFLNAHGQCAPGYVEHEGQCIPSCRDGWRFDMNSGQCIKMTEWDSNVHREP